MEANIFKLELTLKKAKQFLKEEGFDLISNSRSLNFERTIKGNFIKKKIQCEFYYKSQFKGAEDIPWLAIWNDFFNFSKVDKKSFSLNYGCVLISFDNTRYIISYGRSHQTIQKKSNLNFGLDVAEKIIDAEKIQIKSSSFINSAKARTYTQYKGSSYLIPEIGESSNQLVGNISVDFKEFNLYRFKESMKFSTSVKITAKDFTTTNMIETVAELHYIDKFHDIRTPIPRMEIIGDISTKTKLFQQLWKDVTDRKFEEFSLLQLVEEDGQMKAPFEEGNLVLYYYKPYRLGGYNLEEIFSVLLDNGVSNLEAVKVKNTSTNESYDLLKLLDYCTFLKKDTYSLFEGKWAKLNKSFIDFLKEQINQVNRISVIDNSFDLTEKVLKEGRRLMNQDEQYDKVPYDEYPYNIYMTEKKKLLLLDRSTEHTEYKRIEFADLYDTTQKKLTHVKIGKNSDFRYCITQSQNSARIYSTNKDILSNYGIKEVEIIEMLFLTKQQNIISNDIVDFNKSKSINFQLELVTWCHHIRNLNYIPSIVIAKETI